MLNAEEQQILNIFQERDLLEPRTHEQFLRFARNVFDRDYGNRKPILEMTQDIINRCVNGVSMDISLERARELQSIYWDTVLFEARNRQLDSYLIYLEKKRLPSDRFYLPKRRCFLKIGLVQALQQMLDDELDLLSISLPPSTGKAQPLYSKVLTPNGFVRMGELKVGDCVISGTGNKSKVLGVYPQGKKPIYEITFDDGSKCRCSDEHLWTCQTRDDRRLNKSRTIMLKDMLGNLWVENGKRANYSIPFAKRIDFDEKKFDIEPYVLGVLIGDGNLCSGGIVLTTADKQLLDNTKLFMPLEYEWVKKSEHDYSLKTNVYYAKGKSKYRKALDSFGLYNCNSLQKFIPTEYLLGSYEQRLWLLRGLMDTDGTVDSRGISSYCTISARLAHDVVELVHSLGGRASISTKRTGYRKDGKYIECNLAYNVSVSFGDGAENIFALERKKKRFKTSKRTNAKYIYDVQYIGEEECQCIYIDDKSHLYITDDYIVTHNTTIEKFFHSGLMGWFPEHYSLFYSHSGDITRMYYDGVLNIISDSDEYTWQEIFPNCKVTSTNAKTEQININKFKPFPNLQCTSVGASNAGKVRCNLYLLVDDMIGGIEQALNKVILDKLWGQYSVDARQRKRPDDNGVNCKEIHIATRWSVHDIIGRLERIYEGNPRAKFIAVPDIDPVTGKSNFMYDFGGFNEEFYHDQELLMDDISYRCLYKNQPIEREGLLYHDDDLRRFTELPLREPDAILGVCDTKSKGTDFLVLPVMYQYGQDYYLVDCVCTDSADYGVQYGRMAQLIYSHNMQQCEFESNAGGDRVAFEVDKLVKEYGGRCNITTKPTETNKETRIIVNADWVKKHVLFKDKSMYSVKDDYGILMYWLLSYSIAGKNLHDDVCDAMANFALYATRGSKVAKVEVMKNPFRGMGDYGW